MILTLSKTLQKTTQNIASLLSSKKDKLSKDELEEILIECDIDYELVESILDSLPPYVSKDALHKALITLLEIESSPLLENADSIKPLVTLIVGVNGAGKTTSIAKLAHLAQKEGKKVMLAAGDTFRCICRKFRWKKRCLTQNCLKQNCLRQNYLRQNYPKTIFSNQDKRKNKNPV